MGSYDKLKSIIEDIDILISKGVESTAPEFIGWKTKAERFLVKEYGQNSYEFQEFNKYHFTLTIYAGGTSRSSFVKACARDLLKVKAFFSVLLEELQENTEDHFQISSEETRESILQLTQNKAQEYKEKKYQVFVSSTYKDLIEERALVTQCLLDIGCIPVGMEQFPASGMSQMEYIKKMLVDCDYYILILAGKYGTCDSDGISYTEKEYDYAISIGLPVMSFVFKDIGLLQQAKCEDTEEGRARLESFREKVCKEKLVKKYTSPQELQAHVAISMQKCVKDFPAVGWVRADRADNIKISDEILGEKIEKYLHDNLGVWAGGSY